MECLTLTDSQQHEVIKTTNQYIDLAAEKLDLPLDSIPVKFDLRGRMAGMYKIKDAHRWIRYNPYVFARYFSENLATTVPHEVAHYVVDKQFGFGYAKPHGKEWKAIMALFEAKADVTCNFDMTGLPRRSYRKVAYQCACRIHQLTHIRHNRVQRGYRYFCRHCKEALVQQS